MKAFCFHFLLNRPRSSHYSQRNDGAAVAQADGRSPVCGKAEAPTCTKPKVKEEQGWDPLFQSSSCDFSPWISQGKLCHFEGGQTLELRERTFYTLVFMRDKPLHCKDFSDYFIGVLGNKTWKSSSPVSFLYWEPKTVCSHTQSLY